MPALAYADGESKTVRVGWYESPFNMTDEDGNRSVMHMSTSARWLHIQAGNMNMSRVPG